MDSIQAVAGTVKAERTTIKETMTATQVNSEQEENEVTKKDVSNVITNDGLASQVRNIQFQENEDKELYVVITNEQNEVVRTIPMDEEGKLPSGTIINQML